MQSHRGGGGGGGGAASFSGDTTHYKSCASLHYPTLFSMIQFMASIWAMSEGYETFQTSVRDFKSTRDF